MINMEINNNNERVQKILVVEDNKQTRELMQLFFKKAQERRDLNCIVIEAEDGDKAMIMLESEQPDIILCDIGLPKKNGFEVLDYFQNIRNPATPYCFFTFITASPEERSKAFKERVDGFISKGDLNYYNFTLQIRSWLMLAKLERERENFY